MLLVAILSMFSSRAAAASKPHIIHIIGDDVGSNDMSLTNSLSYTPHMDELATSGIRLSSYYAWRLCSPSRTSLLTGRYTFRYGYYDNSDADGPDGGVPINVSMIPSDLKRAGYATHAIGKWHAGFRTKYQTPTYKGFDSFLGYYHAEENYYTQMFGSVSNPINPTCGNSTCCGVDFSQGDRAKQIFPSRLNGTYSTFEYVDRARDIISNHNPEQPLMLYMAFQNVHSPTEAPDRFIQRFPTSMNGYRRRILACMSALDEGIQNITDALKDKGMYNNSIIVFHADNGGDVGGGSGMGMNNYPLRGGKWTYWEGGVRVLAWIHSPLIPLDKRGSVYDGLIHLTDWRVTYANLAGVEADPDAEVPLDGHDVWDAIINSRPSPRTEVVHNILHFPDNNKTCTKAQQHNNHPWCGAAIRVGRYKLVVGYGGWPDKVFPLPGINGTANAEQDPVDPSDPTLRCANMCLFDVVEDISETVDLKEQLPNVVKQLQARLEYYGQQGVSRNYNPTEDPRMCPKVRSTGWWQPYQDDNDKEEDHVLQV
eukprot:TRINITY_DN7804_c0_g1_i1.p1 TRINITY_DN7804_c0_g1~~TRINITY_DN7804_c0_g1_i1.p1  ORF type:complete len:538 (+),score=88.89 TRINITY_DN7804_c0_g1_i1:32-1645(+)